MFSEKIQNLTMVSSYSSYQSVGTSDTKNVTQIDRHCQEKEHKLTTDKPKGQLYIEVKGIQFQSYGGQSLQM